MTPDFTALRKASTEAQELAIEGKLTSSDFARLYDAAAAAVGEHTQLMEGVLMLGLEHGFIQRQREATA